MNDKEQKPKPLPLKVSEELTLDEEELMDDLLEAVDLGDMDRGSASRVFQDRVGRNRMRRRSTY